MLRLVSDQSTFLHHPGRKSQKIFSNSWSSIPLCVTWAYFACGECETVGPSRETVCKKRRENHYISVWPKNNSTMKDSFVFSYTDGVAWLSYLISGLVGGSHRFLNKIRGLKPWSVFSFVVRREDRYDVTLTWQLHGVCNYLFLFFFLAFGLYVILNV